MIKKIYDGVFQVYDVKGLNVYVFSSESIGNVDIYVNYPNFRHMMYIFGVPYEEKDIEFLIAHIDSDFVNIMKNYFIEVEQLEDL